VIEMRTLNVDMVRATNSYATEVELELPNGDKESFELDPLTGKYLDKIFDLESVAMTMRGHVEGGKLPMDGIKESIGRDLFELLKVWFKNSIKRGDGVSEDDYNKTVDIIVKMNDEYLLNEFIMSHTAPSKRKEFELIKKVSKNAK